MARPSRARWVLIQTWCARTPLRSVSQKASAVALGAGRTRADSQPDRAAISHTSSRPIGRSQGTSRGRGAPHEAARAWCDGIISLAMISPNGPALRTCRRGPAGRRLERQQREHELGEAVAFLQMRVARQDEGVDARSPCIRASAQPPSRGRPPAPCRRRRGPGPRPAHRLGLISSWSRRPPCSRLIRCWPTESMRANTACALAMLASSMWAISRSAAAQASLGGLADDHVQADAEAQLAARARPPPAGPARA